jgi:7-keto-8-aminopelargonate synthetase-like enzyme
MSYNERVRGLYQQQLSDIREAGIFKQERFIHSPQAPDIEVEFPSGADLKKVINVCANNYLGLSSHPEVVKAAHEGLDTRGYGMSSVRFICGTQAPGTRKGGDRVPRDRGHDPLPVVHGRQRRRLRGHPDQG